MSNDAQMEILLSARDISAQAFNSVQDHVTRLTNSVFSLNGVLAGVAGAAGLGLVAKGALDATAELQKNAAMAGVTTTAYQELTFAAGAYQISQDALTDGLKELSLRTDEYVQTGAGPAKEAFERLKFTQQELNGQLKDTPGLLREVIRRMEDLDTAAQIRIADEIFGGTGGEQFVAMIDAGATAMDGLILKATQMGVVMDESLIQQSAAAKKEVEQLATVLQANFQRTIAELAPDIQELAGFTADWVKQNQSLIREKVPEYVNNIREAVGDLKGIYDSVPDEVKGAAGLGIVGNVLFGGTVGKIVLVAALLDNSLKSVNLNLGHLKDTWAKGGESVQNIMDVLTGKRDWNTGELTEQLNGVTQAIDKTTKGLDLYAEILETNSNTTSKFFTEYEKAIQKILASSLDKQIELKQQALDKYRSEEGAKPEIVAAAQREIDALIAKAYADESQKYTKQQAEKLKLLQEYNAKRYAEEIAAAKKMADDSWLIREQGMVSATERAEQYQEQETQAAYDALQDRIKNEAEALEEQQELREAAYRDFADTIQENTADILRDWDNAWETMTDIMKDALIEMAAEALTSNIIVPIAMDIGSAMGLSWNGTSMLSMSDTPGGSVPGLPGSTALNWAESNVPGMGWLGATIPGTGAAASMAGGGASAGLLYPGAASGAVPGSFVAGTTFGTALGVGAIGGIGYSMLGPSLGLPTSEYSGLTAGVGSAGGYALGATYGSVGGPVGAIAGAVIGGVLGGLVGGEDLDPDITLKSGVSTKHPSSAMYEYQVDPDDIENDAEISTTTIAYFDAYFSALDDVMDVNLQKVLSESDFKTVANLDDYEGNISGMFSAMSDDIFRDIAQKLVSAMGITSDQFGADFFQEISIDDEELFSAFARFEAVANTFSDFEGRINDQMGDGLDLTEAYQNLGIIAEIMNASEDAVTGLASTDTMTALESLVSAHDSYVESMTAAAATQAELTEMQTAMSTQLGAAVTGLNANSLQSGILDAASTGDSIASMIMGSINTSLANVIAASAAENIMGPYIEILNEQIGQALLDATVNGVINSTKFLAGVTGIVDSFDWAGLEAALKPVTDTINSLTGSTNTASTYTATPTVVDNTASIADTQAKLDIELMTLQGDAAEALAASREVELESMDKSLHATQELIWSLEDLASAANAARASAITKTGWDIELLEAQGNSEAALTLSRSLALDTMDKEYVAIQQQIWALEDAADARTQATADMADQGAWEVKLATALGNSSVALKKSRELELAAMDEQYRFMQKRIWQIEDEQAAMQAKADWDIKLFQAQGNSVAALDVIRSMEIQTIDAEYQAIQKQIWKLEDLATAEALVASTRSDYIAALESEQAKLQEAFDNAKTAYIDGLNTEISAQAELASAAQEASDSFTALAESLEAAKSQAASDMATLPDAQYAFVGAQLAEAVALSQSSDSTESMAGLEKIPGLTSEYLNASMASNTSVGAYQADYAYVMGILNSSEKTAEKEVSIADKTLSAVEDQIDILENTLDIVENGTDATKSILELEEGYNLAKSALDDSWYQEEIDLLESLDSTLSTIEDTQAIYLSALGKTPTSTPVETISTAIEPVTSVPNTNSALIGEIPGVTMSILDYMQLQNAPGFADGGTVFGPTFTMLGEGGEYEHITPDSQMKGVKEELKNIKKVLEMVLSTNGDQNKYAQKTWRILDDSQRGERPLATEVAA